ncbi:uncharacterized protein LOC127286854 [Leptopilina boulardi]|uniref:uncharacterized protein LOC127286854 n=1 Tax=Leptopilina boulardi TaxID=63433 RepID=UPI0021F52B75|nr:uncharacterized protein LOC127286854 [Leptopilina boulardi]
MDRDREPDTYVMTSMVFGSVSSPYTAQYVMQRNALTFKDSHPSAVEAITGSHYVDDYLDSFDTEEEAQKRVKDVSYIQRCCGFELQDWVSNNKSVLNSISTNASVKEYVNLLINEMPVERTLGLKWCPTDDTISFDLSLKKIPESVITGARKLTKREMLTVIMSVYDPLGILLPFVIRSKILIQNVWRSGISWDEELKEKEFTSWRVWISMLEEIKDYQIPRSYCRTRSLPNHTELHVFCDGSEKAYAAVAYVRTIQDDKTIQVSFVIGNARVAPLKPVSIPRMELQAALIASRIAKTIGEELTIALIKRTFWTDSQTVLGWIRSHPRKYQSFVAHRLGEIDELTNPDEWKWVSTRLNPSDHATRDIGNMDKSMNRWINGPEFLQRPESSWPVQPAVAAITSPKTEIKKEFAGVIIEKTPYLTPRIENFRNWICLLRCMTLILMSPNIWKGILKPKVSAEWLDKAEKYLIRKTQEDCFGSEIKLINQHRTLHKESRIKHLTSIVTQEDGILRIDGRINATREIVDAVKQLIILDGKNCFTRLLVKHYHGKFLHGSNETVVNEIKQKFWILKLRPTVRTVASQCYVCRLQREKVQQPRMGDLSPARLGHHKRPFTYCGLDYFGPLFVTVNIRHEKRWDALFTCMTTRHTYPQGRVSS